MDFLESTFTKESISNFKDLIKDKHWSRSLLHS